MAQQRHSVTVPCLTEVVLSEVGACLVPIQPVKLCVIAASSHILRAPTLAGSAAFRLLTTVAILNRIATVALALDSGLAADSTRRQQWYPGALGPEGGGDRVYGGLQMVRAVRPPHPLREPNLERASQVGQRVIEGEGDQPGASRIV